MCKAHCWVADANVILRLTTHQTVMFGLIGSFTAVPGKRRELAAILLEGIGGMPGCRSYVVAEDPTDDDTLWITEVWDTPEAHRASLQLPSVKDAISRGRPLIHGFGEHREVRVLGGHGLSPDA